MSEEKNAHKVEEPLSVSIKDILYRRHQEFLTSRERDYRKEEEKIEREKKYKAELVSLNEELRVVQNQTKRRLREETRLCRYSRSMIISDLRKIVEFARKNSIFPPKSGASDKLIMSIRLFDDGFDQVEYDVDNLESEYEIKRKIETLRKTNATCKIGVEWGFEVVNSYRGDVRTCGIEVEVLRSEIKINGDTYTTDAIDSVLFKTALTDAFYSPIEIRWLKKENIAELRDESKPLISLFKKIWYGK